MYWIIPLYDYNILGLIKLTIHEVYGQMLGDGSCNTGVETRLLFVLPLSR